MGSPKRPKLTTKYTGPRAAEREVVSLDARMRVAEGPMNRVAVLDLDARGCRVSGFTVAATKANRIELAFGDMTPFAARLRWAKNGGAGLRFDVPLSDEQLAEATRCAAPSATAARVIPLRRPIRGGET